MQHSTFEISCHGKRLFGQSWNPVKSRGVVVLVHGMGEHSGRYAHQVVPALTTAGFTVFATDHFGHGQSIGKRGVCPGYEAVLDSVEMTLERASGTFPDLPVFLYGHSMGGNAVLGYCMTRNPQINGVISTSPFLKMAFEAPAWKLTIGKVLSNLLPTVTLPSGLNPEHISRDPEAVQAYREDPLNHDRVCPNFVFPFLQKAQWMIGNPGELEIPALLCHGTGDEITSHHATVELGGNLKEGTLQLFEGGYHELHNDYDSEHLLQTIINWLDQNL